MRDLTRIHFYWAFGHSGNINQWETETIDQMFEQLNEPTGLNVSDFAKTTTQTLAGIIRLLDRMCERFPELIEQTSANRPKSYRLKKQEPTPADREICERMERMDKLEKLAALFQVTEETPPNLIPVLQDAPEEMVKRLLRSYQWSRDVIDPMNLYYNSHDNRLTRFIYEHLMSSPTILIEKLLQLANRDEKWGKSEEGN